MKRNLLCLLGPVLLASCGYSSRDNELVGQVKKVIAQTPIVCGDYHEADVSLGIMRNGVGSFSKEDVVLYVRNEADVPLLKQAAEEGFAVKISYDIKRLVLCVPDHWIDSVKRADPVPTAQVEK